ncbi:MAG: hypothetical protein K2P84_00085 [Undibacterium sp.]|nr:hypothetical protein [Undibacterium sp.]
MKITTKVLLKQDHTHAGAKYTAGAIVEMPGVDADYCIEQGVADVAEQEVRVKPEKVRVEQVKADLKK